MKMVNKTERRWLKFMINHINEEKNKMEKQILLSSVKTIYADTYISIMFYPLIKTEWLRLRKKDGVPIEMHAYMDDRPPISFLIHIKDGFIRELEIFSNDLKPIDLKEIEDLDDSKVQIKVNY